MAPLADGGRFCIQAFNVSEVGLRVENPLTLGWWRHKHWTGRLLECSLSQLAVGGVRRRSLIPLVNQTHTGADAPVKCHQLTVGDNLHLHWLILWIYYCVYLQSMNVATRRAADTCGDKIIKNKKAFFNSTLKLLKLKNKQSSEEKM